MRLLAACSAAALLLVPLAFAVGRVLRRAAGRSPTGCSPPSSPTPSRSSSTSRSAGSPRSPTPSPRAPAAPTRCTDTWPPSWPS
ncbi:hypothetical protein ACFQ1I_21435 [Kitasatospora arboriphila]